MTRIGAKFLELRLRKKITLEEVSNATKIKKDFLAAIEKGDFKKLPSPAYAYGFVKNYAKFLGTDEDEAIALFRREYDSEKSFDVLPKSFSRKEDYSKRIRIGRNTVAVISVFIFVFIFVIFQYKDAILNPPLNVFSPKSNQIIIGSKVEVSGDTDPNSTIYVNENLVAVEDTGKFKKIITVFPGKNIIVVKATNRFGKQSEVDRSINVKPGY